MQTADVHVVEILPPPAPDADERRRMADRAAPGCCAFERRAVAHVAIDERAGQSAARRGAREHHDVVAS